LRTARFRFDALKIDEKPVTDPEKIFRPLCDFLCIPFTPVVFDFYLKKEEILQYISRDIMEKYQSNLLNSINTSKMNLWNYSGKQKR
jgi:hypothetical protein